MTPQYAPALVSRAIEWVERRHRFALVAILAAALALRIVAIPLTQGGEPAHDAADYARHAESIAAGDGYPDSVIAVEGPTALRPPAYPFLLGGAYAVAGDAAGIDAGRVLNAVLGVAIVALVYLLALELWGRREGLVAAAIAAAFPPLVLMNALVSEPLFLVGELAVLVCVLRFRDARRWRWAAAAGVLCGLAALTRANGILLALPALVGLWEGGLRPRRSALAPAAAFVAAAALTVLPWTIRNTVVFDEGVPVSNQAGYGMAGAFNDEARDEPGHPYTWRPPQAAEAYADLFARADLDEAELDAELRERATDDALDHPWAVVAGTALNTLRTFELLAQADQPELADREQAGLGDRAATISTWSMRLLELLALVGVVLLLGRPRGRRGPWFVWLAPVLLVLAAVWISGSTRYAIPAYPFLVLLASVAVVDGAQRLAGARDSGTSLPAR
jgi:4-amino-4-deoxy-L-arabinose transferase-like glycosyltransferase